MTRPELTAFLDQASAASAHAEGVLHALSAAGEGEIRHQQAPKVIRDVLARMQAGMLRRALTGQPTLCEHLSYAAPGVAFWLAYAPELLRCMDCASATGRHISGTAEDHRCDRCRRTSRRIHNSLLALPPVVVDLPALDLAAVPAVVLMAGLCPACHRRMDRKEASR